MKTYIFILIMIPSFFSFCFSQYKNYSDLSNTHKKSVVTIYAIENKEVVGSGTGFFFGNPREIVTNYHVIKNADSVVIKTYDEVIIPVTHIKFYSVDKDIATLVLKESKDYPVLKISNDINSVTDEVMIIGSPKGFDQTVTVGRISAFRKMSMYGKVIQIDASVSHGSSGSPLLNMKGDVIGVVTFSKENLHFAVDLSDLTDLNDGKTFTVSELRRFLSSYNQAEEYYYSGNRLLSESKFDSALLLFNKSISKNSEYYRSLFGIATVNFVKGNYNTSCKNYYKFLSFVKDSSLYPFAINNIMSMELDMKKYIDFYQLKEKTNLSDFDSLAKKRFFMNSALYFESMYQLDSALFYLNKTLELDESENEVIYRKCLVLMQMGKITEALDCLLRGSIGCSKNEKLMNYYHNIAKCSALLGDNKKSIYYYKEVIKIKADHEDSIYNLSLEYNKEGNLKAALIEADKLIKFNKEFGLMLKEMLK